MSSLSKIHFFICFLSINPLFTEDSLWGFFFFCLPFPFLRFACLFDTNFPNIPFLKSNLLSFWLFHFSSVVLVFVYIVYVSAFLFFCCYVGFVFGVFFLCFVFVFFLVLLSVYEKKQFSLQFWSFFWVMLIKRVVWFLCFMFLFLFVFLVLFLSILKNSFVLFASVLLIFCHKTKWSSCLHLVVLLPFFCCLVLNFVFFHSSQKKTPQKTGHSKNPKSKNAEKPDKKNS